MNKIFNINLGGYPFVIDDDAYDHLKWYVETIKSHFADSEGCEEIVGDIEVRMAELFEEKLSGQSIISKKELDEVIKIMGTPEDFGAQAKSDFGTSTATGSDKKKKYKIKTGKRLFRDEEDKVIGGVCSGIAAYLGIEDPLWVRLITVVLIFSGIGFIPYILLWIIVPAAKTSGDRLSMKGEPVNIHNIGKMVEEGIEDFSEKVSDLGKDLGGKKKGIAHFSTKEEAPYRRGFLL